MPSLNLTSDPEANALLSSNSFALLIGMLLDQQISMDLAFVGPYRLQQRLGRPLTPEAVAALASDELEDLFRQKPSLHRYPGSMAQRVHALALHLVAEHEGSAAAIWEGAGNGAELKRRLNELPGFGDQKARIFLALLGKQIGVQPDGWEKAAGDYGLPGHRSIADVASRPDLDRVREFKQAKKAKKAAR